MNAGFEKLVKNNIHQQVSADAYISKLNSVIQWLGGDSQSNVIELLKDPADVKKKIIAGILKNGNDVNEIGRALRQIIHLRTLTVILFSWYRTVLVIRSYLIGTSKA